MSEERHDVGIEPLEAVGFVHFKKAFEVVVDIVGIGDSSIGEHLTFFECGEGVETRVGGGALLFCRGFVAVSTGLPRVEVKTLSNWACLSLVSSK